MKKVFLVALVAVGISLVASSARSSTISLDPTQFAAFSGGTFSTGQGVTINGWAAGTGNSWFGQSSTLQGKFYTNGTFGVDQKVTIAGNIFAVGETYLNGQSTLGSLQGLGNVGLGPQVTINGDLMAGKALNINNSSVIHGNADYGTSYWSGSGVQVDGKPLKDTSGLDSWQFKLRNEPSAWNTGSQYLYYKSKSDTTLLPGSYGSLNADQKSIIHLTAGTYNFSSVYLGQLVQLVADTSKGDVIVNISGGLSTGNSVSLDQSGINGLFSINTKGSIYLGQKNISDANLFNYGSSVSVDQNSIVNGYVYSAGSLYLGNGVTVNGAAIPEPATLIFLILGSVLTYRTNKS